MTATMDIRRLADCDDDDSLSNRMRSRRFEMFDRITASLERPLSILDIGGTNEFWAQRGWAGRDDVTITTVNLAQEAQVHANIHPLVADATDLSDFDDKSFDVAFSNSVIEHLFTAEAQEAMARETRRVARAYWVQTPNYWFPMEPHFLVPGWQWLPEPARVAAIRRVRLGWRGPVQDVDAAREQVREIRLMRRSELARMFPGATLRPERFGGLVKSWIVLGGSFATC
jgi:Methyltransferase domain